MLCPNCLENDREIKLKCIDSRSLGPFRQVRKYACPECNFETINVESLENSENLTSKSYLNTIT